MNKTAKLGSAFAAVLLTTAISSTALAHSLGGSLGTAASATDHYSVNCFDDGNGAPARLSVHVRDNAAVAAPLVSAQVRKGNAVLNTTDAVDGDAAFSPFVAVNGGVGIYNMAVNKTAAGAENYTLEYHCETAAGVHTGTSDPATTLQNQ